MARLTSTVHVAGKMFRPGDTPPEKYARLIGAHCFEGRAHPYPYSGDVDGGDTRTPVPAKAGPGSSKTAWTEYATTNGVEVEDGATRDEIIAALDAAGVPTD